MPLTPKQNEFKFHLLSMNEYLDRCVKDLKGALEKKYGSFDKLPQRRKEQSDLLINTLNTLIKYKDKVPENEKALVYLGLNRLIKKEIANSYWFRSADNSVLYRALDRAVDISDNNILSETDEQAAIKAYRLFESRVGLNAYNKVFQSAVHQTLVKKVLPNLDNAELNLLKGEEKCIEKPAWEKDKLVFGSYPKLSRNQFALNKTIDDNHELRTYGLQRNYLFFISQVKPKEQPQQQAKQQHLDESNAKIPRKSR